MSDVDVRTTVPGGENSVVSVAVTADDDISCASSECDAAALLPFLVTEDDSNAVEGEGDDSDSGQVPTWESSQGKKSSSSKVRPDEDGPGLNLYVSQIPASLNATRLKQIFAKFGPIRSAKVMYESATNASRCLGFVYFEDAADGERAMIEMTGAVLEPGSKPLLVRAARPATKRGKLLKHTEGSRRGHSCSNDSTNASSLSYTTAPSPPLPRKQPSSVSPWSVHLPLMVIPPQQLQVQQQVQQPQHVQVQQQVQQQHQLMLFPPQHHHQQQSQPPLQGHHPHLASSVALSHVEMGSVQQHIPSSMPAHVSQSYPQVMHVVSHPAPATFAPVSDGPHGGAVAHFLHALPSASLSTAGSWAPSNAALPGFVNIHSASTFAPTAHTAYRSQHDTIESFSASAATFATTSEASSVMHHRNSLPSSTLPPQVSLPMPSSSHFFPHVAAVSMSGSKQLHSLAAPGASFSLGPQTFTPPSLPQFTSPHTATAPTPPSYATPSPAGFAPAGVQCLQPVSYSHFASQCPTYATSAPSTTVGGLTNTNTHPSMGGLALPFASFAADQHLAALHTAAGSVVGGGYHAQPQTPVMLPSNGTSFLNLGATS